MVAMSISEFIQKGECKVQRSTITTAMFNFQNWEIVKSINEFNCNTKSFFDSISKLVYYFTHPKTLAWVMWGGLVKYSFWICMFICLLSVIAYIIGWKKGKEWAKGSIAAYTIIMMFNSAL